MNLTEQLSKDIDEIKYLNDKCWSPLYEIETMDMTDDITSDINKLKTLKETSDKKLKKFFKNVKIRNLVMTVGSIEDFEKELDMIFQFTINIDNSMKYINENRKINIFTIFEKIFEGIITKRQLNTLIKNLFPHINFKEMEGIEPEIEIKEELVNLLKDNQRMLLLLEKWMRTTYKKVKKRMEKLSRKKKQTFLDKLKKKESPWRRIFYEGAFSIFGVISIKIKIHKEK